MRSFECSPPMVAPSRKKWSNFPTKESTRPCQHRDSERCLVDLAWMHALGPSKHLPPQNTFVHFCTISTFVPTTKYQAPKRLRSPARSIK